VRGADDVTAFRLERWKNKARDHDARTIRGTRDSEGTAFIPTAGLNSMKYGIGAGSILPPLGKLCWESSLELAIS